MDSKKATTDEPSTDVTSWSIMDVAAWLKSVLHQKYPGHNFDVLTNNINRHMIDGPVLLQLSSKVPLVSPPHAYAALRRGTLRDVPPPPPCPGTTLRKNQPLVPRSNSRITFFTRVVGFSCFWWM